MTNIFIESGTKTSNEYNFVKMLIEQCVGKKEKEDYILITVGGKDNLEKNKLHRYSCQISKYVTYGNRKTGKINLSE